MLKHVYVHVGFHCIPCDGVWWLEEKWHIAYVITSWSNKNDLSQWMEVINWNMQGSKPNWQPNVFIVDAKINNIK
jgi:hypothetical protein